MRSIRVFFSRFASLFNRPPRDRILDEELQTHLSLLIDQNIARGMPPEAARRAAKLSLGGPDQIKESVRDHRGLPFLDTLAQDIRFALRTLRKSPGFTAVAVLTLALGIGANTAIFSAIQTALLRPYPFRAPDRLVDLWSTDMRQHSRDGLSGADYLNFKSLNRSFENLFAYTLRQPAALSIAGHSQRVWSMFATGSILSTLGMEPALGRSFIPSEESSNSHALILSYSLWQSRFAGKQNVLGQTVLIDGKLREIVGVLPRQFDLPEEGGSPIGVMLPIPWDSAVFRARTLTNLLAIARLNPSVSVTLAQSDLSVIANRLAAAYPASNKDRGARVAPLGEERESLQNPLWALFGAVSFVLLIACANVSGLLLARGLARCKEFGVRAALGASRGRLVRQMFTESLLLALLGGGAGLALAWECTDLLRTLGAAAIPALIDLRMDTATAIFAFLVSLVAAIIFGLLPSWKTSALDVNSLLKGSGVTSSIRFRPGQLRGVLVAAQVALAVVVLCGAGVLLRSLHALSSTSPGFDVNHLLTAGISKSAAPAAQVAFYNDLLARVASIPGVLTAAATSAPPLGSDAIAPMPPVGVPGSSGQQVYAMLRVITPGYFRAIGLFPPAGREFSSEDSAAAPRVAIINEWLAHSCFSNGNAVGREIALYPVQYSGRFTPEPGIVRIVGVIPDLKHWFTGGIPHVDPEIYLPYAQSPVADMMLVARLDGRTPGVAGQLQNRIDALDPGALLDNPETMRAQFSDTLAPNRFYPVLLALFAAISLVLASIGIYGIVSYWVRERTQEIGIRMALGARSLDVLRLVILQGLLFVLAGAAVGIAAALALTRFLGSLLYGVTARDPASFVAAAILLISVALTACYIPARRATKVDPMVALRYE